MKPRKQIPKFSNIQLPLYVFKEQLANFLKGKIWYDLRVELLKEMGYLHEKQEKNLL